MNYLVNRGYRIDFLKTQIQRVSDVSRNDALKTKPIRQTDTVFTPLNAAAFIKFLAFPMRRLFKGGVYSRAAFISKIIFLESLIIITVNHS